MGLVPLHERTHKGSVRNRHTYASSCWKRLLLGQVVCNGETHAMSVEGVHFCWVFVKLQEK